MPVELTDSAKKKLKAAQRAKKMGGVRTGQVKDRRRERDNAMKDILKQVNQGRK